MCPIHFKWNPVLPGDEISATLSCICVKPAITGKEALLNFRKELQEGKSFFKSVPSLLKKNQHIKVNEYFTFKYTAVKIELEEELRALRQSNFTNLQGGQWGKTTSPGPTETIIENHSYSHTAQGERRCEAVRAQEIEELVAYYVLTVGRQAILEMFVLDITNMVSGTLHQKPTRTENSQKGKKDKRGYILSGENNSLLENKVELCHSRTYSLL
ncbi:hypothetical protein Zmor_027070 [Zophobas morio]|jgi:hypothetical protein|uniref:Uncharacterized protein n=1 Tax=Zophobas morio TaxID=2755281 RepID=A0AA38HNR6_9CUCU|nr:hypothetical protein Zmor_027070 [Zophobas morio]